LISNGKARQMTQDALAALKKIKLCLNARRKPKANSVMIKSVKTLVNQINVLVRGFNSARLTSNKKSYYNRLALKAPGLKREAKSVELCKDKKPHRTISS
jgi:hypothetical protein